MAFAVLMSKMSHNYQLSNASKLKAGPLEPTGGEGKGAIVPPPVVTAQIKCSNIIFSSNSCSPPPLIFKQLPTTLKVDLSRAKGIGTRGARAYAPTIY